MLLGGALETMGPRIFLERTAPLLVNEKSSPLPVPEIVRDFMNSRQRFFRARKKVAVYGGAFDPITYSHLTCAAELVHCCNAEEVWLVPCGPRPDKPKLKTPAVDRYVMCQVAVNTYYSTRFPVRVMDTEVFSKEAFHTYDMLCALREANPDVDLAFVIGSDWLQPGTDIRTWTSTNHDWKPGDPEDQRLIVTGDKMLKEFDFIVMKRPGYNVEPTPDDPTGLKQFGERMSWLVMPEGTTFIEGNLSSTEIRRRGQNTVRDAVGHHRTEMIEGLLPQPVLSYIHRHGFYSLDKVVPKNRRIAVYGGAFDPITNSHLTCVANIIHSGCADEVWLVPSGPRPDKPGLSKALDRYCMCKIAVNQIFSMTFPVFASDAECFLEEPLFTYDLLCKLKQCHPEALFSFVIGSDWLQPGADLSAWTSKNWDWQPGDPEEQRTIVTGSRMLQEFDFLVIPRPSYRVQRTAEDPTGLTRFGPRLSWLEMPPDTTFINGNLSSTEVRKRVCLDAKVRDKGLSAIDGLIPSGVLNYICRQNLYSEIV